MSETDVQPDGASANAPSPPEGAGERRSGQLAAAISNAMVGLVRQYAGRGPTQAHTTVGRNHVLIMLRDNLTTSEKTLSENGYDTLVLDSRKAIQNSMREDATGMIEELTGRRVIGFLSDNHIDPDLGVEVFIMEPSDEYNGLAEAEATS